MTAMLPQPTLPGKVDGIVSLDPPMIQCHDCGEVWTEGRTIGFAVVLSGCHGWGFLVARCPHEKVRRCGDCNAAHRAEFGEEAVR